MTGRVGQDTGCKARGCVKKVLSMANTYRFAEKAQSIQSVYRKFPKVYESIQGLSNICRNLVEGTSDETLKLACFLCTPHSINSGISWRFVIIQSSEEAEAAIKGLNNQELDGSIIEVALSSVPSIDSQSARIGRRGEDPNHRIGGHSGGDRLEGGASEHPAGAPFFHSLLARTAICLCQVMAG
ncbi:hypothetical protein B0H17DRAFT_1129844 [Mycena rosella]|uniref:RRM domain-containing protein n=1 Tax=Mycena rosella TaxID=1033263 RepID=A0AAD7DSF1_MYCRO|nr:hypothetical protein B0H17DRAFT_1129844 [Mycena rosella]